MGNKTDLNRVVSRERAFALARFLGCQYLETSATTDYSSIQRAFLTVLEEIGSRIVRLSSDDNLSLESKSVREPLRPGHFVRIFTNANHRDSRSTNSLQERLNPHGVWLLLPINTEAWGVATLHRMNRVMIPRPLVVAAALSVVFFDQSKGCFLQFECVCVCRGVTQMS